MHGIKQNYAYTRRLTSDYAIPNTAPFRNTECSGSFKILGLITT